MYIRTLKMNWESEYNQLYQILKDNGYNLAPIAIRSNQTVIISIILLSIYDRNNKEKVLSFLKSYQDKSVNINLCNYLRILAFLIIDDDETINKAEYLKDLEKYENLLQLDCLEIEIISECLKYTNDYNCEKIDTVLSKVETKLSSVKSYLPYFQFLQNFRLKIYVRRLQNLQNQNKSSLYLTSSYHILQEYLFNKKESILRIWYEENPQIIQFILPYFFKSLLLEKYGYLKKSILSNFGAIKSECLNKEILCEICKISSNEFIKLSKSPYINLFDDKEYEVVFNNLIELNIIKASGRFTTIKLQTLYRLCDLNPDYDIDNLVDIILKLSETKKIIVKFNQFDGTLEFPIHKKSNDFKLNQMFSEILPKTLERDWDELI